MVRRAIPRVTFLKGKQMSTEITTVAKPERARKSGKAKAPATPAIIADSKSLGRAITSALATYAANGVRMHLLFVSALWHTATHGNAVHLQRLYDGLRSNDQVAFKQALRRAFAIVGLNGEAPDGLPAEMITAAVENGSIVAFKQGSFVVTKGHTSDAAKAVADLMVNRYLTPDGKIDRMVFERNNFSEIRTLGDADILAAIIKATNVESNDKRVVKVSSTLTKFLDKVRETADIMLRQTNLSEV
jgi:hypothetical protein